MDEYIYIIIEKKYKEFCKKNSINITWPSYWFKVCDYKLKSNILFEAMENNITIEETKAYKVLLDKFKNIITD